MSNQYILEVNEPKPEFEKVPSGFREQAYFSTEASVKLRTYNIPALDNPNEELINRTALFVSPDPVYAPDQRSNTGYAGSIPKKFYGQRLECGFVIKSITSYPNIFWSAMLSSRLVLYKNDSVLYSDNLQSLLEYSGVVLGDSAGFAFGVGSFTYNCRSVNIGNVEINLGDSLYANLETPMLLAGANAVIATLDFYLTIRGMREN